MPGDRALKVVVSRLLVAMLPAAAFGIYAARPFLSPVLSVVLVPWVILYSDPRRPRISILYYAAGAWLSWEALYPQAWSYGAAAAIVMGTACVVLWLPFAPVLRIVHSRFNLPRTLTVPVIWVAQEWLRATFTVGHFDLYALGYSRARFPVLIQIAEITGVYGVSFIVAALNGLVADVFFALRDAGWRPAALKRHRRLHVAAAGLGSLLVLVVVYGAVRIGRLSLEPGPSIAVVQPNILHSVYNARGTQLAQLVLTDEMVPEQAADLIVWPENAVLDVLTREPAYLSDLKWMAERKQSWLLVGALGPAPGKPGHTTNRAFLFDPGGTLRGDYTKQVLFPWSEDVPLDGWLAQAWPWLWRTHRELVREAWGFMPTGVPGAETRVLQLGGGPASTTFACLICNENAYPPLAADAAAHGARFLVNITSEGNLGGPVQEQLLRISVLRAVENRVAFVRDGNTGISCFIDPAGRVQSVLRGRRGRTNNDDGVLVDRVALAGAPSTLYGKSRDAFAKGCVLVSLLGMVVALLGRAGTVATAALLAGAVLATGCASVPTVGQSASRAPAALERCESLVREHHDSQALALAGDACAAEASCREALPYLTDAFRARGAFEAGVSFLDAVERRYGGLATELHLYRGILLRGTLDDAAAERELRAAVAKAPSVRAYLALGRLLLDEGRDDAAAALLRDAAALDAGSAPVRVMLGRALARAGRAEEARTVLERVIAERPDDASAWAALGAVLCQVRDEEGARRALERAAAVDPRDTETRRLLGALALREGNRSDARMRLQEVTELEASFVKERQRD